MALQEGWLVDGDAFVVDGGRVVETVDSVTLFIHSDHDAGLVGLLARQLEARVRGLQVLLSSPDPNLREVRARLCN